MNTKNVKQVKKEIAAAKRQVGVYRTFGKLAFDRSRAVYLQAHSLKKH